MNLIEQNEVYRKEKNMGQQNSQEVTVKSTIDWS